VAVKVLFVCTGNLCRSPMAEYLAKAVARERGWDIKVRSAGTHAVYGEPAFRQAIAVLEEWGIDARDHRSQPVDWDLLDWADIVLTMEEWHKCYLLARAPELDGKVFVLTEFVGETGEVPDPYGETHFAYQEVRNQLFQLVEKALVKLVQGGD